MGSIRVGNGCGFWGDSLDAPIRLAEAGRLDYLTLEYLAELTMSILALQKQKNPEAGFATDFLDVLRRLCPILKEQARLKIITNAGGMNPLACANQARKILNDARLGDCRLAVVTGDDLMPDLDRLSVSGHDLTHLDSGAAVASIRNRLVSANAYLGAQPIVQALKQGASIVITGRVADASLTVAPAVHEFGWDWNDWDRLSAATVAGHLIECGAQVTGGLWSNVGDGKILANVGYPIAEIEDDGTVVITKPEDTGGAVNRETVSEQLLYEVGDPAAYLTPDVTADFTSVRLEQVGPDRVAITGAKGKPATDSYKVSMAYRDGFSASGTLVIAGPNAQAKAWGCGELVWLRLAQAGFIYEQAYSEIVGGRAGEDFRNPKCAEPPAVVLRLSARDERRSAIERFTRELAPLVTSGPPGVTGYTSGRPPVREVFAYWPALIEKKAVNPAVQMIG
ncbi:MAG: acyclic terpene utilization AtuA family protein [Gemmataceae bacterium]